MFSHIRDLKTSKSFISLDINIPAFLCNYYDTSKVHHHFLIEFTTDLIVAGNMSRFIRAYIWTLTSLYRLIIGLKWQSEL